MKLRMLSALLNRQLTTLLGAGALAWGITLCSDSTALAWFDLCNRSSSDLRAAFAYKDLPDSRNYCHPITGCQPITDRAWISEGWHNLKSGECKRVYHHELRKRGRYYYMYGEATDGSGEWTGEQSFCVLPDRNFGLVKADQVCNGERRKFIKKDIGNARNSTFTFSD